MAHPPPDVSPQRPREWPRPGLRGGGYDDDDVRRGGDERPRPHFHLVGEVIGDVIDGVPGLMARAAYLYQALRDESIDHHYILEHSEDMPEFTGWKWGTRPRRRGV